MARSPGEWLSDVLCIIVVNYFDFFGHRPGDRHTIICVYPSGIGRKPEEVGDGDVGTGEVPGRRSGVSVIGSRFVRWM